MSRHAQTAPHLPPSHTLTQHRAPHPTAESRPRSLLLTTFLVGRASAPPAPKTLSRATDPAAGAGEQTPPASRRRSAEPVVLPQWPPCSEAALARGVSQLRGMSGHRPRGATARAAPVLRPDAALRG